MLDKPTVLDAVMSVGVNAVNGGMLESIGVIAEPKELYILQGHEALNPLSTIIGIALDAGITATGLDSVVVTEPGVGSVVFPLRFAGNLRMEFTVLSVIGAGEGAGTFYLGRQ